MQNGWTKTAMVTVLMIVATSGGLASGSAPISEEDGGLGNRFTRYEVFTMEPQETALRLASGLLSFPFGGTTYVLALEPAPWRTPLVTLVCLSCEVEDAVTVANLPVYQGRVVGVEDSRAFLVVTPDGVVGDFHTPDRSIEFEALRLAIQPSAAPSLVVAYEPEHVVPDTRVRHGHDVFHATPGSDEPPPLPSVAAASASSAAVISNRYYADSQMANKPSWVSVAFAAIDKVEYELNRQFGWTLTGSIIEYCTTTACDATYGMTNTYHVCMLRNEWANAIQSSLESMQIDRAHLFTGKLFSDYTAEGCAYEPGRYSVSQLAYWMTQRGFNSITLEETAHNFNADHRPPPNNCPAEGSGGFGYYGRSKCWDHLHSTGGYYHCHGPDGIPLIDPENPVWQTVADELGPCLDWHWHSTSSWHRHHSAMFPTDEDIREFTFSDHNSRGMVDCIVTWDAGTYIPTNGHPSFGAKCTDGSP